MTITINEDTTFLISDEIGNVAEGTEQGLYHEDTRFLSRFELLIDGRTPLLLSARATDHFASVHVLTNPALPAVARGAISIVRERIVGEGLHEDIYVTDHADTPVELDLALRSAADFAHIFEVKKQIEVTARESDQGARRTRELVEDGRSLRSRFELGAARRVLVVNLSLRPEWADDEASFRLELAPGERWHLCVDVLTLDERDRAEPAYTCRRPFPMDVRATRQQRRDAILRDAPVLEGDGYVLSRAYEQALHDFAGLRIKGEDISSGEFAIAAGIPWFMALFGRDSLIAGYQALRFFPDAAKGVLRALARRQGTKVDPITSEQPGKILHEERHGLIFGSQKTIPSFPYYGTVDATPLFLMLVAAVLRTTGDRDFAREMREPCQRAIEWLRRYGDRDGDGYLEYVRETDQGLENQGWKDSFDAIRFRDGTRARPPIALAAAQGYAYAARVGMAFVFDEIGDHDAATVLRDEAADLRRRFDRDFWMEERGYYAVALDGDKRVVDSLTSDAGHLLWTGIVEPQRAAAVARTLLSPDLFSGWGVRTLGASEGGYNPVSYHRGSVWPHDNSLIVVGLARYGLVSEAALIADALLAALAFYPDRRLPELFAGYGREEIDFPVEYPTACRPQAWSTGALFLLLVEMAGLGVDWQASARHRAPFLPEGVDRLRLDGLMVDGQRTSVELRRSATGVERSMGAPHLAKAG